MPSSGDSALAIGTSSSLSDSPSSEDSDKVSLAVEERGKADDVHVGGFQGVDMQG